MLSTSRPAIRSNIIAGILVLVPMGAVLGIVVWCWNKVVGWLDLIPLEYSPRTWLGLTNPIAMRTLDLLTMLASLIIILVFFWTVGLVSRNYLGRKLLSGFRHMVSRVPILSTVYSTLEQLLDTFGAGKAKNFRRVVQVEYPRKGLYTLAFVTGERDGFLKIYVPTTPNPTSGFYLTVAEDEVKDAGLSVEEALKEIISMGIVQKPERASGMRDHSDG